MTVIQSIEDADGLRCVDLIAHPDGTFAFKEFRRDPEDGGRWTLIADYSALIRHLPARAKRRFHRR